MKSQAATTLSSLAIVMKASQWAKALFIVVLYSLYLQGFLGFRLASLEAYAVRTVHSFPSGADEILESG